LEHRGKPDTDSMSVIR